jgi:PhnB protein
MTTESISTAAVTPHLIVASAADAISWYTDVLGLTEVVRLADRSGKVMHAEMRLGASPIMLADEFPEMGYRSHVSVGGSPVSILLYVADVDAVFLRALEAGAEGLMPVADQFDGNRRGTLKDPFGHVWLLATRREIIAIDELQSRFDKMMENHG